MIWYRNQGMQSKQSKRGRVLSVVKQKGIGWMLLGHMARKLFFFFFFKSPKFKKAFWCRGQVIVIVSYRERFPPFLVRYLYLFGKILILILITIRGLPNQKQFYFEGFVKRKRLCAWPVADAAPPPRTAPRRGSARRQTAANIRRRSRQTDCGTSAAGCGGTAADTSRWHGSGDRDHHPGRR